MIDDYGEDMIREECCRTQRRYELARDIACGFAASGLGWTSNNLALARQSVATADALLLLLQQEPADANDLLRQAEGAGGEGR